MKNVKKLLGVFVLTMVAILCVPNSVKAAEMSDEFKSYLNEDGKYEFNSSVPANDDHFALLVDLNTYDDEMNWNRLSFSNVSEDYSEFDLTINSEEDDEETHRVKVQYNYDKNVETKIKNIVNSAINNKNKYEVKDLELVNYQYNRMMNGYKAELTMFSGELKNALNYENIEFKLSGRAGSSAPLRRESIGFFYITYADTIYHVVNPFGTYADHVIYVPTETENTKEALVEAVQKRIDNYLGETDVEVSYLSTAWEYWVRYHYEDTRQDWLEYEGPNFTIEQFEQMGNIYMPAYESFEEGFEDIFEVSGISKDDIMAYIDVPIDENMGDGFDVIIKRDSSKMVNPISKTSDVVTEIEISTNSTLPLDTTIQAKALTSGTEYERILKILNLTDNLTFDLKLYSESADKYITKLEDGTFEVKIPVPENFEGKNLVVYYVNENGEKEPYTVDTTTETGYAIFTTNHFSIYTLGYTENAPTKVKVTFDANSGTFNSANKNTIEIEDIINFNYNEFEKPTRDGYSFVGFYTEKNGGKSFDEVMNSEAGIEEDTIFYARWEKNSSGGGVPEPEEENPKTFDGIGTSIFMGIISLIGLSGATIYLIKKNKVRAN